MLFSCAQAVDSGSPRSVSISASDLVLPAGVTLVGGDLMVSTTGVDIDLSVLLTPSTPYKITADIVIPVGQGQIIVYAPGDVIIGSEVFDSSGPITPIHIVAPPDANSPGMRLVLGGDNPFTIQNFKME